MDEWARSIAETYGYLGVALLMLLENVFPPLPSELIMPFAGYAAARGELTLWGAILAGATGSLVGATLWYAVGRGVGEARLRRFAETRGAWIGLGPEDLDRSCAWFHDHGRAVVFFGRLIPGVRTLISIPAGLTGMPFVPFLTYTALGTLLWTAGLAWAGSALGENYEAIAVYVDPMSWAVLTLLGIGFVVWVARRVRFQRRRRREREARAAAARRERAHASAGSGKRADPE